MLIPDMTTGTRIAALASLAWQTTLGASNVEPVHVLLGLLHEEEGVAAQLLLKQNIGWEQVLRTVTDTSVTKPELTDELPVALPSLLTKLLYAARHLALGRTGNPQVHSDQLLAALVQEEEEIALLLETLGVNLPALQPDEEPSLVLDLAEPLRLGEPQEQQSLARIIDANTNRAREALRVLEELARFHLNDSFLTRTAKTLRHQLTDTLRTYLPGMVLLSSRETQSDVGTRISNASEYQRHTLSAVLQANAQRLQEALRSLEEYGKIHSAALGAKLEKLRYQSYTLERALFLGQSARTRLASASLYLLVSKSTCVASLEWTLREAAAGGVAMVQLREKQKSDRELLAIAREARAVTRELGLLFIMNDRPDLARLSQADGVHLGQEDLEVHSARSMLGPDAIIGVSTHDIEQLQAAILAGADYVGVGPTFPSQTKSFDAFAGLEYVRQVAAETTLPAYAIGGITPANVEHVVSAGLRRVAVGHAITQAEEPREAAALLRERLLK
jgi:thiamine-phosphate pyrophosphorylase